MYINFKKLIEEDISADLVITLSAIRQKETEWLLSNLSEEGYKHLCERGCVKHIKSGKKSDHTYLSMRLSDVGESFLKELGEAPVSEEDEKIFNWLKSYYIKAEKDIGNGARTKRHLKDFRIKSGIEKNNLIKLVLDFLKENEEKSRVLEYVFYFPKNAFSPNLILDDSWLYKHYQKNEKRLLSTFEQY